MKTAVMWVSGVLRWEFGKNRIFCHDSLDHSHILIYNRCQSRLSPMLGCEAAVPALGVKCLAGDEIRSKSRQASRRWKLLAGRARMKVY